MENKIVAEKDMFVFYPLKEKEIYNAKLDDYSWYSNGSVIDTDTETENIANLSFGGQNIMISFSQEWDNVADGMVAIAGEERQSLLISVDGEAYKVLLKYFYATSWERYIGVLWTKNQLVATLNQWYKSPKDVLGIAFNLNFRHRLPESLRNFEKIEEISSWLREHPEESKRIENIKAIL